jgi:hypothetical protein
MRMKALDDVLLEVTVPRMITAPTRIVSKRGELQGPDSTRLTATRAGTRLL